MSISKHSKGLEVFTFLSFTNLRPEQLLLIRFSSFNGASSLIILYRFFG